MAMRDSLDQKTVDIDYSLGKLTETIPYSVRAKELP
jgi:hypothetical protein